MLPLHWVRFLYHSYLALREARLKPRTCVILSFLAIYGLVLLYEQDFILPDNLVVSLTIFLSLILLYNARTVLNMQQIALEFEPLLAVLASMIVIPFMYLDIEQTTVPLAKYIKQMEFSFLTAYFWYGATMLIVPPKPYCNVVQERPAESPPPMMEPGTWRNLKNFIWEWASFYLQFFQRPETRFHPQNLIPGSMFNPEQHPLMAFENLGEYRNVPMTSPEYGERRQAPLFGPKLQVPGTNLDDHLPYLQINHVAVSPEYRLRDEFLPVRYRHRQAFPPQYRMGWSLFKDDCIQNRGPSSRIRF